MLKSNLKTYEGYPPITPTHFSDDTLLNEYKFKKAYVTIQHHVMNDEEQDLAHELNDANHYVGPHAGKTTDLVAEICNEGFDVAFKYGFGEYIVRETSDGTPGVEIYPKQIVRHA